MYNLTPFVSMFSNDSFLHAFIASNTLSLLIDDVTSMSFGGSQMALTSLTLIILFITLELKNFSCLPYKYCFCPRVFSPLEEGF